QDARAEESARRLLERTGALRDTVSFYRWPTNRVWTRDFGPIFITAPNQSLALLNFGFTAWAKYPDWELDDRVPHQVARALKLREWRPEARAGNRTHRVVLEGGSIDVNGAGTMLTTCECLLSTEQQCRNPALGRDDL